MPLEQPGREIERDLQLTRIVAPFTGVVTGRKARLHRLVNAGDTAGSRRRVFEHYTPELLDGLLLISAASSVMSYALYTIWPTTVAKFGTESLLYTVPFVTYGIFRYLYLVRATETSEDPAQVLLTDRPLGVCIALYLLTVVVILYFRS